MAPYLDPASQTFIDAVAASGAPPLYTQPYASAREFLETAQQHSIPSPDDITVDELSVPDGPSGKPVSTFIYRPTAKTVTAEPLPLAFYFHGGGWVLGSPHTHDSLVRDLTRLSGAAIVFPYYTPAPEAQYPAQFEEVFAVIKYFLENGKRMGITTERYVFVGDSAGELRTLTVATLLHSPLLNPGHMSIAISTLLSRASLPLPTHQSLFYPVTQISTAFTTSTYETFADGPYLSVPLLRWMVNTFLPVTISESSRATDILISPLSMTKEQVKQTQPKSLIVTAGVDPLREEGEMFAELLQGAGVECAVFRAVGVIHDFVMLEGTRGGETAKMAVELVGAAMKRELAM
ncbi:MAG: hypothetical protein M1834_005783 [Cirrosporium novae-zelandiae]|nr:MAG: hypothetical protein M1834_005783 [Cirrosporium novae-zelandiae]